MRAHRVQLASLCALIAATAIGCTGGANSATTASVSTPTYSSTLFVPYVQMTSDASTYVAVDPALTTTLAAGTELAADGTCAAVTPSSATAPRSTLLTTATSDVGEFAVNLVDAPNPIVNEMWITVDSVSAHVVGQGWVPLKKPDSGAFHFNLFSLRDGAVPLELGFASLQAGDHVTQIRLLLSSEIADNNATKDQQNWPQFVILADEAKTGEKLVELKVPSGYETGIKIIGPWTITGCQRLTVTLDFDGEKSLWYHPNGPQDEWILRPVIHTKGTALSDLPCATETPVIPPPIGPEPMPVDGTTGTSGGTTGTSGGTTGTSGGTTGTSGGTTGTSGETTTTTTTPSGTTLVCTAGTGTGTTGSTPPGQSCAAASECTSGTCVLNTCTIAGAGQSCSRNAECLSGACYQNTCTISATGQSCARNGDCESGLCMSGTCAPSSTGLPAGSACSLPAECASSSCYQGSCMPALSGQACNAFTDCVAGLVCVTTTYTPMKICLMPYSQ